MIRRSTMRLVIMSVLVFSLAGCGDEPKKPSVAPEAPVAMTCPVCGGPFASDRKVVVPGPGGGTGVCSNACAIRHEVAMRPPAPDSRGASESLPADEDE